MTRYALYFAPQPDSLLWHLGSSAIGYDAHKAQDIAFPDHPIFKSEDARPITAEPRKYGFHATLKAPFTLQNGTTADKLLAATAEFARTQRAFHFPVMHVATLENFIALVPKHLCVPLQHLAAETVRYFEPFRAPLTEGDRQRRLHSPLSARQIQYMDQFGYPYIFEEFRFHMTLTGPLAEPRRSQWHSALQDLFKALPQPLLCDSIAVFKQNSPAERFTLAGHFQFSGL